VIMQFIFFVCVSERLRNVGIANDLYRLGLHLLIRLFNAYATFFAAAYIYADNSNVQTSRVVVIVRVYNVIVCL